MSLVNALEDFLSSMQILVIRGEASSAAHWAGSLEHAVRADAHDFRDPYRCTAARRAGGEACRVETTVAYLCTGMTCSAPLANLEDVVRTLKLRVT